MSGFSLNPGKGVDFLRIFNVKMERWHNSTGINLGITRKSRETFSYSKKVHSKDYYTIFHLSQYKKFYGDLDLENYKNKYKDARENAKRFYLTLSRASWCFCPQYTQNDTVTDTGWGRWAFLLTSTLKPPCRLCYPTVIQL